MRADTNPGTPAALAPGVGPVTDALGRPLEDLRISVTDRCNFRCVYCMPRRVYPWNFSFLSRGELLRDEEIEAVARACVGLGVTKIRLTGGEPLLRPGLEELVARLARIPGVQDLALTTNGALLAEKAEPLRRAGLHRVTVSLDALDDATFAAMSDTRVPVARILDGIAAAQAAGLPVKINAVIRRGVNEHSVPELAGRFRGTGHVVRFIEYMDVGTSNGWKMADVVPAQEILARIHARWPLEPLPPQRAGEVAERYRYVDGQGEIGVIAAITRPFCRGCRRLRLSADGKLYTCLFAGEGHDVRSLLRSGATVDDLAARIREVWRKRTDRYSEVRSAAAGGPARGKAEMFYLGG